MFLILVLVKTLTATKNKRINKLLNILLAQSHLCYIAQMIKGIFGQLIKMGFEIEDGRINRRKKRLVASLANLLCNVPRLSYYLSSSLRTSDGLCDGCIMSVSQVTSSLIIPR